PHPPTSTLFPYTTLFRSGDSPLDRLARVGNVPLYYPVFAPSSSSTRPLLLAACRHLRNAATHVLLMVRRALKRLIQSPRLYDVRSEEHTSELQSRSDLVC